MKRLAFHILLVALIAIGLGGQPKAAYAYPYCNDISGTWSYDDGTGHGLQTWSLTQDNSQNPPVVSGSISHVWVAASQQYATYLLGVGGQTVSIYRGDAAGGSQYGTWEIVGYNVLLNGTYGGVVSIRLEQPGCAWFSFLGNGAYRSACQTPTSESDTPLKWTFNNAAAQFSGVLSGPSGFSFNGRTVFTTPAGATGGTCKTPGIGGFPVPAATWYGLSNSSDPPTGAAGAYTSQQVGFVGDTTAARYSLGQTRAISTLPCTITYTEQTTMDCPLTNVQYPQVTLTPWGTTLNDTITVTDTTIAVVRNGTAASPAYQTYGMTGGQVSGMNAAQRAIMWVCSISGAC